MHFYISNINTLTIPTTALRWRRAVEQLAEQAHQFEHLVLAKAGYRPDQPRDQNGRWEETGATPQRSSAMDTWGKPDKLNRHVDDHGKDFGANSAEEYTKKANDFLKQAKQRKLPAIISKDGVLRIYDPTSNTFGAYNPDGTTRTFYKPPRPNYFNNQINMHGPANGGVLLNIPSAPTSGGSGTLPSGGVGGGGAPMQLPGRVRIKIPGYDV